MIINCNISYLKERCDERGYTLEEVSPCIISADGENCTIDTESEFYPKHPKIGYQKLSSVVQNRGPGTELKKILSYIGITATPTCSCNDRARRMDEMEAKEPGWCTKNMDTIIGWLREESEKRGLPFVEIVARGIVNLAIKRAKKNIK